MSAARNSERNVSESNSPAWRIDGRWIVAAMLLLAFGLALYAFSHFYRQQRRPIDFWGTEAATLLVRAPHVSGLRLEKVESAELSQQTSNAETITDGERQWRIIERRDLSKSGGITHARRSLMTDSAFDWSDIVSGDPQWEYALVFGDGQSQVTMLISVGDAAIGLVDAKRRASIAPSADALGEFLEEKFQHDAPQ